MRLPRRTCEEDGLATDCAGQDDHAKVRLSRDMALANANWELFRRLVRMRER